MYPILIRNYVNLQIYSSDIISWILWIKKYYIDIYGICIYLQSFTIYYSFLSYTVKLCDAYTKFLFTVFLI